MSTYNSLLDLAESLIQEKGFAGFSYADLADRLGIRKASIHHHFPTKNDLGLAYCDKKNTAFLQLETQIQALPPGREQLKAYLAAFSRCAAIGQLCGAYAMMSDSGLFTQQLRDAVSRLANTELRILHDVLDNGRRVGDLRFEGEASDMAVIVCNAVKGALALNRMPPHDTFSRITAALLRMLE